MRYLEHKGRTRYISEIEFLLGGQRVNCHLLVRLARSIHNLEIPGSIP